MTELLPWVFTSGWASGVNAYAVVLVLGLLGRFAGVDAIPIALQHDWVLLAAAALYALEFVVDKIPWLDSTWDAVHTAVRPSIAAAIGLLLAGEAGTITQALSATAGGVTALASHAVKAGMRAAINTSPEPASNIVVSVTEDVTVAGVIGLAVAAPWVAAGIAALLLVAGLTIVVAIAARIRRARRERHARRSVTGEHRRAR